MSWRSNKRVMWMTVMAASMLSSGSSHALRAPLTNDQPFSTALVGALDERTIGDLVWPGAAFGLLCVGAAMAMRDRIWRSEVDRSDDDFAADRGDGSEYHTLGG
jgi:hypothetical protein